MARAIHDAMTQTGVLVAEAGTGTGKTFAYLVPALLAGGKVIISTGTKTLRISFSTATSRRCAPRSRAARARRSSRDARITSASIACAVPWSRGSSPGKKFQLHHIRRFAAVSPTGDRADLADVPEDAPVWAHATSTRDNCLGQACPDFGDCFVMRARRMRSPPTWW